jgi:hypothetical protein
MSGQQCGEMWQMKDDEENRTKPRLKGLVGRQRSHTDDRSSSSAMPHPYAGHSARLECRGCRANTTGSGKSHRRRATNAPCPRPQGYGILAFRAKEDGCPSLLSQAGNKRTVSMAAG